ncbi:MAG: LysR family transcriptional regulator [Sphingomonadales bacterium]
MIDLRLIRYFLAVVDTGSFTKAAERAAVTQPSLSAGIAKLEQSLGAVLFERSNRRVSLTPAGTKFLGRANAMMREFELARRELAQTGAPLVLRLGVIRTLPSAFVGQLVRQALAAQPDCAIDIVEGSEIEVMNALNAQSVDMAIGIARGHNRQGRQIPLFEEGYSLALSADHGLAGSEEVAPEAFQDQAMILRSRCEILSETSRFFTSHNVRPRFAYRTDNDERALAMAGAGLGTAMMPDCYVHPMVARPRLKGFAPRRRIIAQLREGAAGPKSPAMDVLIETARRRQAA